MKQSTRAPIPYRKISLVCLLTSSLLAFEAVAGSVNTHIRTLASSCVTCHGTNPLSKSVVPSLAGLDASYFIKKMQGYRSSDDEHAVMTQHAKGLTEQEIQQLAIYFSGQSRACPLTKKHPVENSWSK